jgi:Transketolase, thiamine diphosphate binding domain
MVAVMMHASINSLKAAHQQPACAKHSLAGTPLLARRAGLQVRLPQRLVTTASGIEVPDVVKIKEPEIDDAVNAIRFLSIDGVNAAKSGHPGLPMG